MTRSGFLRLLLSLLVSLLFTPWRVRAADMKPRAPRPASGILPITPTARFYVEDINGPPDSARQGATHWRLRVHGQVAHPLSFDYPSLVQRPAVSRIITLSCIGNPVGSYAIGNAEWRGVPLTEILREAQPTSSASWLVLRADDGYFESIPLKQARHPGALLATHMNRERLTPDHGFPLRLMIPGLYGIKQVKWLREMELSEDRAPGYWHKRGWSPDARVQIFSRIDFPRHEQWMERGTHAVRGIAFAGDRGVEYVQVSTDGERTWNLAQLEQPLSDYSWVFWSYPVTFPQPGRFTLSVRAADKFSGIQRGEWRDPFPNGVTGYHRVEVLVF